MSRCALCGRKISNVNHIFGLNCLKKMCNFMEISDVKKLRDEVLLNRKIL